MLSARTLCNLSLDCGVVLAHDADAYQDAYSFSVNMHGAVNAMGERCTVLDQCGVVSFSFSSHYAVNFNIHHHDETETSFPIKLDNQTNYQGEFLAEPNKEYCFTWQNKNYREAAWAVLTHVDVTAIESVNR